VSGAMAERVFAAKLERAGFTEMWVGGHQPFGIDEASLYPLFTQEVIAVMRRTIPLDRQSHVATGVIVKARRPVDIAGQKEVMRSADARPASRGETR